MVETKPDETPLAVAHAVMLDENKKEEATPDPALALLVEKLSLLTKRLHDTIFSMNSVSAILTAFTLMELHLPENSQARESVSRTNIVESLVCLMRALSNVKNYDTKILFSAAMKLTGHLVSGRHVGNITACYHQGIIPVLLDGMRCGKASQEEILATLHLLQLDGLPLKENNLLTPTTIQTTVMALNRSGGRSGMQEWGSSQLLHLIRGWVCDTSSSSAGENQLQGDSFLGALNALKSAFTTQHLLGSVVKSTSQCIEVLAKHCPEIRSTLISQGFVEILGKAMAEVHPQQKGSRRGTSNPPQRLPEDVQKAARAAIMVLLALE